MSIRTLSRRLAVSVPLSHTHTLSLGLRVELPLHNGQPKHSAEAGTLPALTAVVVAARHHHGHTVVATGAAFAAQPLVAAVARGHAARHDGRHHEAAETRQVADRKPCALVRQKSEHRARQRLHYRY